MWGLGAWPASQRVRRGRCVCRWSTFDHPLTIADAKNRMQKQLGLKYATEGGELVHCGDDNINERQEMITTRKTLQRRIEESSRR